ncbi:MAG TPA: hypothetical protein VJJ54_00620, partial [Gemmatimonadales bacterium]|nr:hypothetical protein [Gemmatimonadales bacterium]
MRPFGVFLVSVMTGCAVARTGTAPVAGGAAPSPAAPGRDSFHITVVYPAVTDIIQSHDSLFLLGSVRGGAGGPVHLGINGQSVPVLPNGAWIAWLPLPDDTVAHFLIAATGGGPDSSRFVYTARIAPQFRPPPGRTVWIDTTSFTPAGTLALPREEGIPLTVQATPGATVRLRLPWGSSVPLVPDTLAPELPGAVRAFVIDSEPRRRVPVAGRYVGWLPAAALCVDGRTACATLVVTVGADTAMARWPLDVNLVDRTFPAVVVLDDDTAHTGTTDSLTPGRAVPHGTYNWFFPTGTVAVESARWNDQVRLQLSRATVAWVSEADVVRLPPGTPPPGGVVSSVRLTS